MTPIHHRRRDGASSTPEVEGRRPTRLIGTGGRRDALFFAAVVEHLQSTGVDVTAIWAGARRRRAEAALSDADVHLHCGRPSRIPWVVRRSSALGVPAIVRDAPAFDGLAVPFCVVEVTDVALLWPSVTDPSVRELGVRMLALVLEGSRGRGSA